MEYIIAYLGNAVIVFLLSLITIAVIDRAVEKRANREPFLGLCLVALGFTAVALVIHAEYSAVVYVIHLLS